MEIRRYQPEDFRPLLDLVNACYRERAEPPEWWLWRHFEYTADATAIWLALNGPRVIGMRPMTLFDYCLEGRPVKGAMFSAVMVDPDFRRQGVFRRLVKEASADAWKQGAAFATTMPNDQSYPAFRKIGWADPGDRVLLVRGGEIASQQKAKKPDWPVRFALAIARFRARIRPPKSANVKSGQITEVDSFPTEVSAFMQCFSESFPGPILRRSAEWLNWRFASHRWNQYRRFLARTEAGNPAGLVVTNRQARDGVLLGYIVDLVAFDEETQRTLIRQACQSLIEDGAALILAVVSPGDLSRTLSREGFLSIPGWLSPKKFHTVYQANPELPCPACLNKIQNWYQTLGDWDGI